MTDEEARSALADAIVKSWIRLRLHREEVPPGILQSARERIMRLTAMDPVQMAEGPDGEAALLQLVRNASLKALTAATDEWRRSMLDAAGAYGSSRFMIREETETFTVGDLFRTIGNGLAKIMNIVGQAIGAGVRGVGEGLDLGTLALIGLGAWILLSKRRTT